MRSRSAVSADWALRIIGQDTRLSGDMIAHALAAGICAAGVDAELVGVLPTPGIAHAVRSSGASAGVVVSASHNPYQDHGIKVFSGDGFKLSDEIEAEIVHLVISGKVSLLKPPGHRTGRVYCNSRAGDPYADFLKECVAFKSNHNSDFKIVLDCAHGATLRSPSAYSARGVFP